MLLGLFFKILPVVQRLINAEINLCQYFCSYSFNVLTLDVSMNVNLTIFINLISCLYFIQVKAFFAACFPDWRIYEVWIHARRDAGASSRLSYQSKAMRWTTSAFRIEFWLAGFRSYLLSGNRVATQFHSRLGRSWWILQSSLQTKSAWVRVLFREFSSCQHAFVFGRRGYRWVPGVQSYSSSGLPSRFANRTKGYLSAPRWLYALWLWGSWRVNRGQTNSSHLSLSWCPSRTGCFVQTMSLVKFRDYSSCLSSCQFMNNFHDFLEMLDFLFDTYDTVQPNFVLKAHTFYFVNDFAHKFIFNFYLFMSA